MQCHRCGADIGNRFGLCDKCRAARKPEDATQKSTQEARSSAPGASLSKPQASSDYPPRKSGSTARSELTCFAGFWPRLFAGLLDAALLSIFGAALFFPLRDTVSPILLHALLGLPHVPGSIGAVVISTIIADFITYIALSFVSYALLGALYFSAMESSPFQATPGKLLNGLAVSDLEGEKIGFLAALKRHTFKCYGSITIPLGFLLLITAQSLGLIMATLAVLLILFGPLLVLAGFVLSGFSERRQAFHDLKSDCLVLYREEFKPTRIWGGAVVSVVVFLGTIAFLTGLLGTQPSMSAIVGYSPLKMPAAHIYIGNNETRSTPHGTNPSNGAPLAFD